MDISLLFFKHLCVMGNMDIHIENWAQKNIKIASALHVIWKAIGDVERKRKGS